MRAGNSKSIISVLACVGLLCLASGTKGIWAQGQETAVAQTERDAEKVIRGKTTGETPAPGVGVMPEELPIKGVVPKIRRQGLDGGPDLELAPCEVLCDRGGGYSVDVCERYGYSDQFTYMVRARLRNIGYGTAEFQEGGQMWSVAPREGLKSDYLVGVSDKGKAPRGGLSLVREGEVPDENSPGLQNLILAPGKYSVIFTADPENLVEETSERNNSSECSWEVVATASASPFDLALVGLSVFPDTGPPWSGFTIVVRVKNLGQALPGTIEATCVPGGSFYDAGIEAGQEITMSYPIAETLVPGTQKVTCTVRAPAYSEHDTSNNTKSTIFFVTPL